jgi:hypothetical protein
MQNDVLLKGLELGLGGELAVNEQVTDLEKVGLLGQLFDRNAAVSENASFAVEKGDRALACPVM